MSNFTAYMDVLFIQLLVVLFQDIIRITNLLWNGHRLKHETSLSAQGSILKSQNYKLVIVQYRIYTVQSKTNRGHTVLDLRYNIRSYTIFNNDKYFLHMIKKLDTFQLQSSTKIMNLDDEIPGRASVRSVWVQVLTPKGVSKFVEIICSIFNVL